MANKYHPDQWMLIQVGAPEKRDFRVFATWAGSFMQAEKWRLNSGVTSFKEGDPLSTVGGKSGSEYCIHLGSYGTTAYGFSTLAGIARTNAKMGIRILGEEEALEVLKSFGETTDV